jgi:sarcosine oxidase subunit delta
MLRIPCPYCGTRDEPEFRFGGEAHLVRPGLDADDSTWADYLFNRENPKGIHFEHWLHKYGCGRWFQMARNTVTHEIVAVYTLQDPRPDLTGSATG